MTVSRPAGVNHEYPATSELLPADGKPALLEREDLKIASLKRDKKQADVHPTHDCHVLVFNDKIKLYRRRGSNQNSGSPQQDCFILRRDGSIEGDIDWDYDHVTRIEARPLDEQRLMLT